MTMGHAKVYQVVSAVVPCAHMAWVDDSAPNLPWATYHGDDIDVWSDNSRTAVRHNWTVELYEKRRDKVLEQALGNAIEAAFGGYTRRESWIESEQCLMISYDFDEIEGEFDG